jgi:hypothetical protein
MDAMSITTLGLELAASIAVLAAVTRGELPGRSNPARDYVGNEACRPCHAALVESYSRTAMARTSGPATPDEVIEGTFAHEPSGILFRIERQREGATLGYSRPGDPSLNGSVRLEYYVGSNTRGRTYLFALEGFLYQSPVNYYAGRRLWDMSPGYQHERELPLDHPVDNTCLFCHASQIQPATKGTANRFTGPPFLQPGVGCERCHGPGGAHIRDQRAGAIVNPVRRPLMRGTACACSATSKGSRES